MLPVLDNFMNEHKDIKPNVATYAAMLSEERLTELQLKTSPILSELGWQIPIWIW
ncbi:MAG: hypothetical protein KA347_02090 [Bacteroidia bacterium]|nr:hypothetical protein [Bacteroidota bacterium]MBP6511439.1 hypothetical protein [Bacteroidia bacterium]